MFFVVKRFAPFACVAAISCLTGFAIGNSRVATAQQSEAVTSVNPQEKVLYANLYMQTSAEYRAVCQQIYWNATEKVRARLSEVPATETKQPAVVMDLDETVIDNGGYQSYVDRERTTFQSKTWSDWEANYASEVKLIPGAKAFIEYAEANGIAVVYLSNRNVATQAGTIAALQANGLSTVNIESRLLLQEPGTSSNKTDRRKKAMEKYRVVMIFGDNLRDFSEDFATPKLDANDTAAQFQAIENRKTKVDAARSHFGVDWFILPNPVYGEWEKPLGANPRSKLRETSLK
ncbi:MAG: hypothetical protein H7Y38_02200 [Armatimonadetes bacterium]|nr:hypothetical protein [Armatimonadota bacterium]